MKARRNSPGQDGRHLLIDRLHQGGHATIRVNGIAPETTDSEQVPLAQIIKPGYEARADRILQHIERKD